MDAGKFFLILTSSLQTLHHVDADVAVGGVVWDVAVDAATAWNVVVGEVVLAAEGASAEKAWKNVVVVVVLPAVVVVAVEDAAGRHAKRPPRWTMSATPLAWDKSHDTQT